MNFIKRLYHFLLAWLGNIVYGFPSKKLYVIGVTGTKGKSTVTELISAALEAAGKKTAVMNTVRFKVAGESEKNARSMTMPGRFFIQSLLRRAVRAGCEYAILEVTSQGVLQFRHRFIHFDAAVFLNLHPEHIEAHGSFEAYRSAKARFFSDAARGSKKRGKLFFINRASRDKEYFADAVAGYGKTIFWSREEFAERELRGGRVSMGDWLSSDFNLENAAATSSFCRALGIPWETIRIALASFRGVPGRMEYVQREPFAVVVDYAHTPDSLRAIYRALRARGATRNAPRASRFSGRLICVLGAAGGGRDKWKRPQMGKIAAAHCDEIFLTSEDPYDENPGKIMDEIFSGLREAHHAERKAKKIVDRKEAIASAIAAARPGDTVVMTGMGSQSYFYGPRGAKISWDERAIAEEALLRNVHSYIRNTFDIR